MSNPSILDLPDEILVKIILQFDARERLALGNSCQKFNDLVFSDSKLLRNLDFTGEWQLTRASNIQQYFNDENTYKKILGINTENVQVASSLGSSIGKSINLVELNILNGLRFKSVEELSRFLKPLVHLKRLSINWPSSSMPADYENHNWNHILEESLSRLTYLSLQINLWTKKFLLILLLCQQLEELRVSISGTEDDYRSRLRQEPMKLSSLKSVRLMAPHWLLPLKRHIMGIVLDPAEWTELYLVRHDHEIYLERNVEVCPELSQVKEMPLPLSVELYRYNNSIDEGWALVPENLLSEVIRVSHEDVPETFCCLSWSFYSGGQPCLLEIDDAKKLLKDPVYQISFLHFQHVIEKNCDVHLVASAFPNLTTLFLSRISNRNCEFDPSIQPHDRAFCEVSTMSDKNQPLHRRLRRKGSLVPAEDSDARDTDTSFKMLVENTPRLKVLEISPERLAEESQDWDLEALYLISGWKNLSVIRLCGIPITDGKFLIEVGKECKKLEEVMLRNSSPDEKCGYESELLRMLQHCKNLRKLIIQGISLEHLSDMFNILSNCSKLAALRLPTITEECDPIELTLSVEGMLRQCQELKRFSINRDSHRSFCGLKRDIQRIISELNRQDFQFDLSEPDRD